MPTYRFEGSVTLKACIVMDAEDEQAAWDNLAFRLRARLFLSGEPGPHETDAEISSDELAISRA